MKISPLATYRHKTTGQIRHIYNWVQLDRFFDNRCPFEWVRHLHERAGQ